MQWDYCQICAWSVPVGTRFCEVCTVLLANPAQTCVAEARVIVEQLGRAVGQAALRHRYQEAQQARRRAVDVAVWEDFMRRNGEEQRAENPGRL
jgi:hypothetical protein